ncbi:substrate-binding domain-containing protein [Bacillus taeanensis]|uniref:D-ribose ABC transporter substrate-binding protein n=1 Tax=Bacillus taeanensis TaxID=273032 RepID=A0A366XPA9_9BACI|nr:substrate-binding domain-containing protein [Bacillus taeanensis]RBW68200.1 D-ribose ABC transporter substrate-binding protein [Bacillus taeanensis]
MKKILLSVMMLALVMFAAACSSSEETSSSNTNDNGSSSDDGKIKIGLSNSTQNIDFFVALNQGVEQGAEQNGFELISANANNDTAKQIADIEDLIQQGVRAILVNPQDAEAIVPAIEKANEANIPVIALDRGSSAGELLSFLETDNVEMGRKSADFIAEKLKERYGEYKGKVVELQGLQGTTAARDRGQGFNEQMESKYPNIEIIARQPADFNQEKALNVMTNILQAHGEIDAVFGHNDDNSVGAANAIEQAGRFKPIDDKEHIIIIGIDGNRQAIQAIENGRIDATISQIPIKMGEMGVDYVKQYLNGEEVEDHTYTRNFLVTKENIDTEELWAKELKAK